MMREKRTKGRDLVADDDDELMMVMKIGDCAVMLALMLLLLRDFERAS